MSYWSEEQNLRTDFFLCTLHSAAVYRIEMSQSREGRKRMSRSRGGNKTLDPLELKAVDRRLLKKLNHSKLADKIFAGTMFVMFDE